MVTIEDVAKRAGVSKSSVSRVLNGNLKYMSEEMKQKILTAVEELNYTPNSIAQSLKKKKSQVIGIILADITNPLWSEVLKGIQDECRKNGYGLMVSSSNEDSTIESQNVQIFRSRQVDGLIVNTAGNNTALYKELLNENYPFVLIDRLIEGIEADSVVVNSIHGTKQAVQYLIDQGHNRIAFVQHTIGSRSPRIERLEGYKLVHALNNLPVDESLIKICNPEPDSVVKATEELLSMDNRPTAIFATSQVVSLEVLKGVQKSGLTVPRDVSIIGYDDFPWIPLLNPPLSTVAQPAYEMGVKSASLLINRLKKKRKAPPQKIQLQPQLIIRESCRSIRK